MNRWCCCTRKCHCEKLSLSNAWERDRDWVRDRASIQNRYIYAKLNPKAISVIYVHSENDFIFFPFLNLESFQNIMCLDGSICPCLIFYFIWQQTWISCAPRNLQNIHSNTLYLVIRCLLFQRKESFWIVQVLTVSLPLKLTRQKPEF